MTKGWNAKGLLTPLYARVGGRDELSRIAGVPVTTLSAVNSGGRAMGMSVAQRIADAVGVSLVELGAPEEAAAGDPRSRPVLDRLAALEDGLLALATEVRLLREGGESQQVRPKKPQGGQGGAR